MLDRLLEDEGIEIACDLGHLGGRPERRGGVKAGLVRGGREAARENLDWVWSRVGRVSDLRLNTWMSLFTPGILAEALEFSPAFSAIDLTSRVFSPYDYGRRLPEPARRHRRRPALRRRVQPRGARRSTCARRTSGAARSGCSRAEIGPDAILASACLPTLFRAVEIDDPGTGRTEAYWDGGYTGNPALFPLYSRDLPADIVVVNINPLHREELPTSVNQIQNRINEIGFNTSLLRELRAIDFVQRLIETGTVADGAMKQVLVHMIADDALMNELSVATKLIPLPSIVSTLKAAGRAAADAFLAEHRDSLGVRGTVDLRSMFD